jgi:hypothetical protein
MFGKRPRMAQPRGMMLAVGMLTFLLGCANADVVAPAGGEDPSVGTSSPTDQVEADPREETPSALEDRWDPRLPEPLVDPDLVLSGGPPPDGIPAIDAPVFEPADEAGWLEDDEPVLSLTVGGETRAYPLQVMTWHEIVNDTVDGVPVAVTYCPLCNSGVAFERRVDGRVLSFGTSGMLYADNLVMYDRQTESLWPQLTGQAAIGVLTGEELVAIPVGVVAWSDFRDANPSAPVLTRDTGFDRPYGSNPYVGYDDPDGSLLFGLPGEADERLAVKERVVGIADGAESVAVVRSSLVDAGPTELRVGRKELVIWHRPGQASALDAGTVAGGADIGTVGVFDPEVDGRRLHFETTDDGFRDQETGSRWNVLGQATGGPLEGARLEPHRHLDTFWFAWVTFHPDTELVDLEAGADRQ